MSSTTSSSLPEMASPSRVIVIGAGWTGLAAAKTYLQIYPHVSLTIIDEDSSVGGVWSESRVYPGLVADSCAAIFDYSDFPMDVALGLDKWADLPAEKVHEYLELYTDKFGLRQRCKLNTRVVNVERDEAMKEGAIWKVEIEVRKEYEKYKVTELLLCDKLIIATGTTSTPNIPEGLNWKELEGPVMHSKDVGQKHNLLTADNVKRVTVVGGSKSSIDVVSLCALAGKEVDWVIREEGYGPITLFEPRTYGIHAGAIKNIRATTLAAPNLLITEGFWYKFLHSGKSKLGPKLLDSLMKKGSKSAIKSVYGKNGNTMKIAPDMKEYASVSFKLNCFLTLLQSLLAKQRRLCHPRHELHGPRRRRQANTCAPHLCRLRIQRFSNLQQRNYHSVRRARLRNRLETQPEHHLLPFTPPRSRSTVPPLLGIPRLPKPLGHHGPSLRAKNQKHLPPARAAPATRSRVRQEPRPPPDTYAPPPIPQYRTADAHGAPAARCRHPRYTPQHRSTHVRRDKLPVGRGVSREPTIRAHGSCYAV